MDALTARIDAFANGAVTLEHFVQRLVVQVSQMELTVLGSKLGDTACG